MLPQNGSELQEAHETQCVTLKTFVVTDNKYLHAF